MNSMAYGCRVSAIIDISSDSESSSDGKATSSNHGSRHQEPHCKDQHENNKRRRRRPIADEDDGKFHAYMHDRQVSYLDLEASPAQERRQSKPRKSKRARNISTSHGALVPQEYSAVESLNDYKMEETAIQDSSTDFEYEPDDMDIDMNGWRNASKARRQTRSTAKRPTNERANVRRSKRSASKISTSLPSSPPSTPPDRSSPSHQRKQDESDVSSHSRLPNDRPLYHALQTAGARRVKTEIPATYYRRKELEVFTQYEHIDTGKEDEDIGNDDNASIDNNYHNCTLYDSDDDIYLNSDYPIPSVEQAYAREQRAKLRAKRRLQ